MNYAEALHIAEKLKADLAPYCERIEIAGSVRRKKPENIKDIEIVCIPKSEPNLFGESLPIVLYDGLLSLVFNWDAEIVKNGPKYKQFALPMTKLDLFITTPECWGVIFAIRTGPADYSKWLVTPRKWGGALPDRYMVRDGRVWDSDPEALDTPEEDDFFAALELEMPEPWERTR